MGIANFFKKATNTDLNNDGKVSGWERVFGLDPAIRGGAALFNGLDGIHPRTQARNTYSPMQNGWSGEGRGTSWSPMKRQDFSMAQQNPFQVNDFTNSFGNMGNTGLSGGSSASPWANPYKRQEFNLSQPMPSFGQSQPQQPQDMFDPNGLTQFGNTGLPMGNMPQAPRPTPNKMPVRNGLDFMNTIGSAYQSRNAPLYQPSAMQANNGYFDMNKANTVNGNWVNGAGWRTDANKAFGQTEEDMAFNAQMAQRLGTVSQ
jgi:hypothetical protein